MERTPQRILSEDTKLKSDQLSKFKLKTKEKVSHSQTKNDT
jgi:hypothetical protein